MAQNHGSVLLGSFCNCSNINLALLHSEAAEYMFSAEPLVLRHLEGFQTNSNGTKSNMIERSVAARIYVVSGAVNAEICSSGSADFFSDRNSGLF